MPEEGFVVEQRDLGGWGLVKVMSARELPICSATPCCVEEINKLKINVTIKTLSTEESTKVEDIQEILRNQVVFAPICKLDLFLEIGDSWVSLS